jgi:ribose transport system permease protein
MLKNDQKLDSQTEVVASVEAGKRTFGLKSITRYQSLIILGGLFVIFTLLTNRFLTPGNLWTILRQSSVNLCLAVGMT